MAENKRRLVSTEPRMTFSSVQAQALVPQSNDTERNGMQGAFQFRGKKIVTDSSPGAGCSIAKGHFEKCLEVAIAPL